MKPLKLPLTEALPDQLAPSLALRYGSLATSPHVDIPVENLRFEDPPYCEKGDN